MLYCIVPVTKKNLEGVRVVNEMTTDTCLNDSPFIDHPIITGFGLRSRLGRKAAIEESESSSTTPTTAAGEGKQFTWQEVAEHNTAKSVWVTVRGKVYDITGAFAWPVVVRGGAKKKGGNVRIMLYVCAHGSCT